MGLSKVAHDPEKWVSLRTAEREGASLGTLATAVEQRGVYGWDEYGRFFHWKGDESGGQRALVLLARAFKAREDAYRVGASGSDVPDDIPDGNPWHEFGWPESDCPDFKKIAAGQSERRARDEEGNVGSEWLLIGLMRTRLVGRKGSPLQPPFTSDRHFMRAVLRQYKGVRGLGVRTMQGNLSRGKDALNEACVLANLAPPFPTKKR